MKFRIKALGHTVMVETENQWASLLMLVNGKVFNAYGPYKNRRSLEKDVRVWAKRIINGNVR